MAKKLGEREREVTSSLLLVDTPEVREFAAKMQN